MSNFLLYFSTFVMGAIHTLEPGHGKSIIAFYASKNKGIKDGLLLLFVLLITHFSLLMLIGTIFSILPNINISSNIKLFGSLLLIFYGFFLLKKKSNKQEYLGCNCGESTSNDKKTIREQIWLGFVAGITPCPSVLSPIFVSIGTDNFNNLAINIFFYFLGVVIVFLSLFFIVKFLWNKTNISNNSFLVKINPHLFSGILMIAIGVYYFFNFIFHFGHNH